MSDILTAEQIAELRVGNEPFAISSGIVYPWESHEALRADNARLRERSEKAEEKLAFLREKGITVGMYKESGKEPRLSYDIARGSELCDLRQLQQITDLTCEVAALAASLAAATAERDELREAIRYWSYCTWQGILKECREESPRFRELCTKLEIRPYAESEASGPFLTAGTNPENTDG